MANGNGHNVGYVRVSSIAQNLDRQLSGIELDKVFTEKASAKDAKRPKLQECIQYLREGDTLFMFILLTGWPATLLTCKTSFKS